MTELKSNPNLRLKSEPISKSEIELKSERKLKLIIVDDEAEIREGINRAIAWTDHGIEVAGLANNGREALRMIETLEPDMLLLDIRMPVMSGLEVLEKLPEQKKIPRVAILSGYDDFNYCQQALRSGVSDYLLKPCRPQDILAVIRKMREQILTTENEARKWDYLQSQFRENLGLLREKLLIYLIQHETMDPQMGLIRWRLYEMEISPENIGVALVRTDNLKTPDHMSGEDVEFTKLAVRNAIKDCLQNVPALQNMICDYNDDLLVLWNIAAEDLQAFTVRMEGLRQRVAATLGVTVTIGIGEPAALPCNLYASFNSAFFAVEQGFWEGPNQIIHYSQISNDGCMNSNSSIHEEDTIIQCIRTSDNERVYMALDAYFENVARPGVNTKEEVQRLVTALICSIYHVCVERGLDTDKIFGPNLAILGELGRTTTIHELKQKIRACLNMIFELYPSHKTQWKVVNNALKYMEENYSEDLSLESVAQKVFVSAGYLSTIFKQVLQKNFVDSLHEIRVQKAKERLGDHHAKIYEIAVAVGYKDEKYFSQIFKKITGMTPNQYRDSVS
jgi:two-component system response regulator YesN